MQGLNMRNPLPGWQINLLLLLIAPWHATAQQPALAPLSSETGSQTRPLTNAHAHNDYYHTRPLLDALDQGFCSVEADVFLVDDQLLVGHGQSELTPERSLQNLYLDPLREIAAKNGGKIYPNGPELTLLVDIKDKGESAFENLQILLQKYPELISSAQSGKYQKRGVRVIVSGDRAIEKIRNDEQQLAGIDGRPSDLDSEISSNILPLISDNWSAHFDWRGQGEFPAAEKEKLNSLVKRAHASGRRIRFWATRESPAVWQALLDAKVDLIGTDRLEELSQFLQERVPQASQSTNSGSNLSLPRSTPEEQGISSTGIAAFIVAADQQVNSIHSFMLVRHGHVVAEAWWKPESPEKAHVLWSLSKSLTSTAVGLAVAEGKLNIDDPILKFFPNDAPPNPSENLKKMRVRDLLTMTAGHQVEVNLRASKNWVQAFLAHEVPHKPGTHFQYNTPATYMLSAIVQKVTGEPVVAYLQESLFEPLGIDAPRWDTSPQGISIGGYGLFLKTEDIAKFGQLYLQNGRWNGKQLLPESWVKMATSKQVSNGSDPAADWDQGYGFQFWRCRHGAYRGDGKDGQFCIVLPELDAVIAITSNTGDMQAELNVVWDNLLSAFNDHSLPADPNGQAKLKQSVEGLSASK